MTKKTACWQRDGFTLRSLGKVKLRSTIKIALPKLAKKWII